MSSNVTNKKIMSSIIWPRKRSEKSRPSTSFKLFITKNWPKSPYQSDNNYSCYTSDDLEKVSKLIEQSNKIIVLTGAGISVESGIPDFRSKGGLYDRVSKKFSKLIDPQLIFDIDFFTENPIPFYTIAKDLYPGNHFPTSVHKFIKLIEQNGKLLRDYTQNIDTLEREADIQNLVECHGSFATASCTNCNLKVSGSTIKDDITAKRIPYCPVCTSDCEELAVLKPDIVFFGEDLPNKYYDSLAKDKDECDLLIVIGTSLQVKPVSLLPSQLPATVKKILINLNPIPDDDDFHIKLYGDCQKIIRRICSCLGNSFDLINKLPSTTSSSKSPTSVTPLSSQLNSLNSLSSSTLPQQEYDTLEQNEIISILKKTWPMQNIKNQYLCLDIINYISTNYVVEEINKDKKQTHFKHYILRDEIREELLESFPDINDNLFFTDFNIGKILKIAINLIDENELVKYDCKVTLKGDGQKRCYVNLKKSQQ